MSLVWVLVEKKLVYKIICIFLKGVLLFFIVLYRVLMLVKSLRDSIDILLIKIVLVLRIVGLLLLKLLLL